MQVNTPVYIFQLSNLKKKKLPQSYFDIYINVHQGVALISQKNLSQKKYLIPLKLVYLYEVFKQKVYFL